MGLLGMIFGSTPNTKAEIDAKIASLQKKIYKKQARLSRWRVEIAGSSSPNEKNNFRSLALHDRNEIARLKGKIASLRAKRKSCKI